MYGLPQDFDGSFFVGREVEIISYTANSIFLGFGNNVSITTESSYECRLVVDEEYVEKQQPPVASSRLMQLVGRKVTSVSVEGQGTLILHFEGSHVFRCFDDQSGYESYRITHGDEQFFI